MFKQFLFQTLLRCKYHVGFSHKRHWLRKYFWRLESARKFAEQTALTSVGGASIVWRKDFKPMFTARPLVNYSIHEDAKNFSTNI